MKLGGKKLSFFFQVNYLFVNNVLYSFQTHNFCKYEWKNSNGIL